MQLYKITEKLKDRKMSVTQAFAKFDKDKNGTLSKKEMIIALRELGISNLNDLELQQLVDSIDLDLSGEIDYKEFARKLRRCGLKVVSGESNLMR